MRRVVSFVARELREALPATLFFLVLFHLVAWTRVALLGDVEWSTLRAAGATIGALLVAKAVLVVHALRVPRFAGTSNLRGILWRSGLGGLVVLLFKLLEEWLPRVGEAGASGAWSAMLEDVRWPVFVVLALWILAGLVLYTLLVELSREVRGGSLRAFLARAPEN